MGITRHSLAKVGSRAPRCSAEAQALSEGLMDLTVLLEPRIDLTHLARILNELGHSGRVDTIGGWGRSQQAAIYEAAKGFSPIALDHFVPDAIGPMTEVIHHGKSTSLLNHFQKCFCRPGRPPAEETDDILWGYSHREWH